MEFRRGGQRDERRRRVLMDEMLAPKASSENSQPDEDDSRAEAARGRTYSDAALVQYQPRVSCVIPKRIWSMLAVLVAGASAIAGIELLYAKVLPLAGPESATALAMLDPTTTGSLASWFASLTLFLGTLGCFLVYSIRRHRLDDYRGRYSVWLWVAGLFLLASFDAATNAHQALTPLLVALTGTTWLADGAIWSTIAVVVLFGAAMIRIGFEVWSCRAAASFLGLAAASYIASAVFTYSTPLRDSIELTNVVSSATLLSAHFGLIYAVLVFARHVYLEAQGERRSTRTARPAETAKPAPAAKRSAGSDRKPAKPRLTAATNKTVRVDDSHEAKEAPAKKQPATAPAKQPAAKAPLADSERPMSKAERRRLRKLERRQKRTDADV